MAHQQKKYTYAVLQNSNAPLEAKMKEILVHLKKTFGGNAEMSEGFHNTCTVKVSNIDVRCYLTHVKGNMHRSILRVAHIISNIGNISVRNYKDIIFEIKETYPYKDGSSRIDIAEVITVIKKLADKHTAIKEVEQKAKLNDQLCQMTLLGKIRVAIGERWKVEPCKETISVYISDEKGKRKANVFECKEGKDIGKYHMGIGERSWAISYVIPKDKMTEFMKSIEGALEYAQ